MSPAGETGGPPVSRRVLTVSALAMVVAGAAAVVAQVLIRLIGFITNLSFYGRLSSSFASPAGNHLGWWVVAVPIVGGLIVGLLARYGSAGIRGHGIPEAMEQVLTNQSRIPARLTILKPLSAAIAIGTGGPFGAEGPIIATGGALGSLVGQLLKTTGAERKTLLAAGATAGMAATFGAPISSVLLAVELLLFEYRPASLIPVALASVTATGIRLAFGGFLPVFSMPAVAAPQVGALVVYGLLGAVVGGASVWVTHAVYSVEEQFERLPIHWMWWPALGAVVVGIVGYFAPRTLGVGYDNISDLLGGQVIGSALITLFVLKFVSWVVALGSGTSGGTLAPLFIIGGGLGAALGSLATGALPWAGVDFRVAALVGMVAMFAGASRAFLASVVFAFEATRQPYTILPLLAGGVAAYLVSYLLMRDTIMTRKIVRRGVRVIGEYGVDTLEGITVGTCMRAAVVTVAGDDTVTDVRRWLDSGIPGTSHQGFPVVGEGGELIGVITRRDLHPAEGAALIRDLIRRAPITVHEGQSLRAAADLMVVHGVGRLPVVSSGDNRALIGIITRSDLLRAHEPRLEEAHHAVQGIDVRRLWLDRSR
ncbi:MAG TPA: chloride channel protein [Gemmatimonadales bacterium]|jgi:CIC family chloride channel protein|nr:chloride channel protein [Gemmatimonadales bacterium]